jgi:hypothetical protein
MTEFMGAERAYARSAPINSDFYQPFRNLLIVTFGS